MNDGQVDKMFHVFGSKSKEVLNQFMKFKKNRFYLDPKLIGDCYCEFIIIDASEIEGNNLNQWIEGKVPSERAHILIVDDKQYVSSESLIANPLKLVDKSESSYIFKNHGELVSVLEALSELQNGHSVISIDDTDFMCFLEKGQYYWSDTASSLSIDELQLRIVNKLENVKDRAKQSGLKLSGLFGCMKGIGFPDFLEDYEMIFNTLRELEPLLYNSSSLMIHTNLRERSDMDEGYEMEFHMLWSLSEL